MCSYSSPLAKCDAGLGGYIYGTKTRGGGGKHYLLPGVQQTVHEPHKVFLEGLRLLIFHIISGVVNRGRGCSSDQILLQWRSHQPAWERRMESCRPAGESAARPYCPVLGICSSMAECQMPADGGVFSSNLAAPDPGPLSPSCREWSIFGTLV